MESGQATSPSFKPEAFGKYTLVARIASGGMGELLLARLHADAGFEKLVVIKRILPHLTDKQDFINMFLDEARIAARITHPNVCQIYELGQVEGRYYMALEYLEGITLAEVITKRSSAVELANIRLVAALVSQACEGLHFAHNLRNTDGALAGVVHRDVNPRNIFVTSAGVSKVLDFGIVKARGALQITRTGNIKGTYSYMSPEQLQGEDVDRRSDVFSLGVVSWEALTGRRLFKRESDFRTWKAITEEPIPPPSDFRNDIPQALDQAVLQALARDRRQRFPTARDFAIALEHAVSTLGAPLSSLMISGLLEKAFHDDLVKQRKRLHALRKVKAESPQEMWDDDSNAATILSPASSSDLQRGVPRAEGSKSNQGPPPVAPRGTEQRPITI